VGLSLFCNEHSDSIAGMKLENSNAGGLCEGLPGSSPGLLASANNPALPAVKNEKW